MSVTVPNRFSKPSISRWLTETSGTSDGVSPPAPTERECSARAVSASTQICANVSTLSPSMAPTGYAKEASRTAPSAPSLTIALMSTTLFAGHVDVFGCRHVGEIAGRQPPESLDACRKILGDNSSQVVEADLSPGEARKHCARVFVQVAQQSVPDALVRDRQKLFLHCFDRVSRRITSGESVTQIYLGKIETDREGSGEPANGP